MAFLVYKLTCTVSDKSYVGITARALSTRWLEHCARARQDGRGESRLYAAMRKYGADSFTFEVIDTCDTEDEARRLETAYIRQFDSYANGYNANEGGHGWLHVPEEVRRKSSLAQKGRTIAPETRARMSVAKLGDSRCAAHLGDHTKKGDENPRAGAFLVEDPNGRLLAVAGMREFCRENDLNYAHMRATLSGTRKSHMGYVVLQRLGVDASSRVTEQLMESK